MFENARQYLLFSPGTATETVMFACSRQWNEIYRHERPHSHLLSPPDKYDRASRCTINNMSTIMLLCHIYFRPITKIAPSPPHLFHELSVATKLACACVIPTSRTVAHKNRSAVPAISTPLLGWAQAKGLAARRCGRIGKP
jgi:hypothetical protein